MAIRNSIRRFGRRFGILRIIERLACVLFGIAIAILPAHSSSFEKTQATHAAVETSSEITASAIGGQAEALISKGRESYRRQRFSAAVSDWSQAAELLGTQRKAPQQALVLSYLTAAYQQLGQWQQADESIARSLNLISTVPDAEQVKAQVYNTFGSLHFAKGSTQAALETWQQAADLYKDSGDEQRYFNNLLNQVQAQQALGFYHQAGDTLRIVERDLPQQPVSVQARGYQQLGQAYRLIGELEAAQTHLETALEIAQQQSSQAASILIELGNTAQLQGDFPGAIAHYQKASTAAQTEPNALNSQIKSRLNLLRVLAETNPVSERDEIASITTHLATDLPQLSPGRSQIYAYIHAAQSLLTLGTSSDLEIAVGWLTQALQQSLSLQDSRAETYARGYLGQAYEISQQWADAQRLTQAALTTAQTISANDIAYQWQWQLGRLLKQQNQQPEALQTYRDAFTSLQSIRQDLSATHQDLQFSFRDSVEPVYRELVDLLLSAPEPKREEARAVIESLQVAELDNFFSTACLEAQQVALEDVEQTDAAIVYPIILRDRLEIIVSLPGQPLGQYTTAVSQQTLEQTLTDWRQNLEKPFTTPEGKALGQTLYQWLIQPMQADLAAANIKTLVFVPDGALRNVPIAALYNDERYLIEDYAIALSPGLQLLGPRSLQDTSSAALLAGLTQSRHGFSELSNVANELQTVNNLVSSRLLLNEAFTTTKLSEQVAGSNRPIVHLATHGQFSSSASETFILAWDRPIPVVELSALLKTGDLNRRDPIELLILSACETATGDSRAALGLAGVALQSGTRSTLASLWNLNDASGAAFIDQFYQALTRPQTSKAEALRQAQIALLKNPNYRHPTYWSAYVLVGSWL